MIDELTDSDKVLVYVALCEYFNEGIVLPEFTEPQLKIAETLLQKAINKLEGLNKEGF